MQPGFEFQQWKLTAQMRVERKKQSDATVAKVN